MSLAFINPILLEVGVVSYHQKKRQLHIKIAKHVHILRMNYKCDVMMLYSSVFSRKFEISEIIDKI